MPRSFDFSVDSRATVEQIYQAFCKEHYWWARLAKFGGVGKLESLVLDADGTVNIAVRYDLKNDGLPRLVAKFYPLDWQLVQTETWCPTDGGVVRGEIRQIAHGAPGSGAGTLVLAPSQTGSRLDGAATVEFRIPLIGGKIESLIGRQLGEQTAVIQRFTAGWIEQNG